MAFKKKFAPRRKFCRFCADADLPLDYKRPEILRDYITERGKIIARRITGTCAPVRWLCCSTPPAIPLT